MGGGTALVEATALGRQGIGVDINPLAVFVSSVKTAPLSDEDIQNIQAWAAELPAVTHIWRRAERPMDWIALGYQRNISDRGTWRIRKALELALSHVDRLSTQTQKNFARCLLLKTAQWALDCRTRIPGVAEFRERLLANLGEMVEGAQSYGAALSSTSCRDDRAWFPALPILQSVVGVDRNERIRAAGRPALILTSPPYPGVHVLYHRWQVRGRRETPAPYWIADCLDGNFASYYTFGDRQQQGLVSYFNELERGFSALARVSSQQTLLVQPVAFSEPSWQLPRYLRMLEAAGFCEIKYPAIANGNDERVWRAVPNRKWYADQRGAISASKEAILFHRLR
jgi:hypothetical protein